MITASVMKELIWSVPVVIWHTDVDLEEYHVTLEYLKKPYKDFRGFKSFATMVDGSA